MQASPAGRFVAAACISDGFGLGKFLRGSEAVGFGEGEKDAGPGEGAAVGETEIVLSVGEGCSGFVDKVDRDEGPLDGAASLEHSVKPTSSAVATRSTFHAICPPWHWEQAFEGGPVLRCGYQRLNPRHLAEVIQPSSLGRRDNPTDLLAFNCEETSGPARYDIGEPSASHPPGIRNVVNETEAGESQALHHVVHVLFLADLAGQELRSRETNSLGAHRDRVSGNRPMAQPTAMATKIHTSQRC